MGKIELDRTFEERTNINIQVVNELDKASDPWGVKVLRYEIKNITPPKGVLDANNRYYLTAFVLLREDRTHIGTADHVKEPFNKVITDGNIKLE